MKVSSATAIAVALFNSFALAVPVDAVEVREAGIEARQFNPCPIDPRNTPLCCAANALGLISIDCQTRKPQFHGSCLDRTMEPG